MKKIIFTEKAPAPIGPYNQAVLSETHFMLLDKLPSILNRELITDNINDETKQVMENILAILEAAE
jgi:2-iminobutanoate/2-iminopropanoate deaminase